MRKAIVVPVFPPYLAGIGNVAYEEARGLAARNHKITIFTPFYGAGELEEEKEGFKIKRLKPFFKFGNAAWLPQLGKELKGFDIIHLHYPFIGVVSSILKFRVLRPRRIRLWRKSLEFRVPLIITYHMDLIGRGWRGLFFKLYTRLTLPKIVRAADKIIVSSLDYARHGDLASYLEREPEKFVEAPFGVDRCHPRESGDPENVILSEAEKSLDSRFRGNDNDGVKFLKNKLGIKKEEGKVILFVGGLDKAHYFKGVDILLKAFQKLISNIQYPISKLLIIGEGNLRQRYERQAKGLGLENNVIFAGRVPPAELANYYQSADVLVLPSTTRSEAYGLVLLEAMSQGVPVIASDLPGVRVNVGSERGILVPPGDSKGLSRALAEILSDEEKRKQMGQRAREWVEKERGLDKEIMGLDKIIKECYKRSS